MKSYIYLFWKLIYYLKFNLIDIVLTFRISKHILSLRNDILNNLDEDDFDKINKDLWNKTSRFCYKKIRTKNI